MGTHYLGVFTLFNALVHLIISKVIYERDLADRKLFDLLSAFGILFVTLTIPVQFNGTWVTTLWAVEMAFLFWFGRTKNLPTYEKATYPVWILTSLSVVHDWGTGGYFNESLWLRPNYISPVFNIYFLTTLIILAAFVFILKMHLDKKNDVDAKEDKLDLLDILSYFIVLFVTVAVAVEFNGVAVTILWAVEMALFFWLGRTKNFPAFEKSTYVLWVLTTCSLVNDWFDGRYLNYMHFNEASRIPSVLNIYCLITVVVIAAFTFTRFVHSDEKYRINRPNLEDNKVFDGILLTALVGLTYALFFNEINNFFSWKYDNLLINQGITDNNILRFRTVWLINYTVLFTTILNVLNLRKYKNSDYAAIAGVFGILSLAAFLTGGLYILGELKNAYLYHEQARYFPRGIGGGLLLRYVSYALVAVLIYVLRETKNAFFAGEKNLLEAFDIMVSVTLLWVLSSEMVHWLELSGFTQTYKWAISVLFGVFALGLIVYGINTHKKHLRFLAIGLFILTLIKVFAFDLMGLDTIHKTIVMISLGVLLLIVSFLYTKFKDVLFTDEV